MWDDDDPVESTSHFSSRNHLTSRSTSSVAITCSLHRFSCVYVSECFFYVTGTCIDIRFLR